MKLMAQQVLATLLVIGISAGTLQADSATKKKAKPAAKRGNPAYQMPEIQAGLPNVLIIGDSISIGYTLPLRAELDGEANVIRPATNCGPTTNGVENLTAWIGDRKWDVIHFNFGLHDLKYMGPNGKNLAKPDAEGSYQQVPIKDYRENIRKIASRLKKTGATVIWRETTPVPKGSAGRVPGDSAKYNAAAATVIAEIGGIEIDAMFDYASKDPIVSLQKKANVHYDPAGSKALAAEVAKSIRAAIKSRN